MSGAFSGISRDNEEFGGIIGLETTYKNLVFANLGVGYFINKYEEEGVDNVGDLDLSAEIEYALSPKWLIGAGLTRQIDQNNDIVQGEVETVYSLSSEYEVFSKLFLDGEYRYEHSEVEQINREDDDHILDIGLLYLLNQNLRARLGYTYRTRESTANDASFDQNTIFFSLIGRL